jgi:hypothetical protein
VAADGGDDLTRRLPDDTGKRSSVAVPGALNIELVDPFVEERIELGLHVAARFDD